MHLVDYLLQHKEYGLPEILRAVKILDSKRRIRLTPAPFSSLSNFPHPFSLSNSKIREIEKKIAKLLAKPTLQQRKEAQAKVKEEKEKKEREEKEKEEKPKAEEQKEAKEEEIYKVPEEERDERAVEEEKKAKEEEEKENAEWERQMKEEEEEARKEEEEWKKEEEARRGEDDAWKEGRERSIIVRVGQLRSTINDLELVQSTCKSFSGSMVCKKEKKELMG